jgi:hypothetical protein
MNLFATDASPILSAQALDDKRVRKMLLETAQLLCTALHHRGESAPYKASHVHHPITLWVCDDPRNAYWALKHGQALAKECDYRFRLDRPYKAAEVIASIAHHFPRAAAPITFQNSARRRDLDLDFTMEADTHQAYRRYLRVRWAGDRRTPVWTRREAPAWRGIHV